MGIFFQGEKIRKPGQLNLKKGCFALCCKEVRGSQ